MKRPRKRQENVIQLELREDEMKKEFHSYGKKSEDCAMKKESLMMKDNRDCPIHKVTGLILFRSKSFFFNKDLPDLKRDSSVWSAKDSLIKNSSHIIDVDDENGNIDKSFTKLLLLITILSIFFLFWIQNSHYHLIEYVRSKSSRE